MSGPAEQALESAFREEWGRVVATLIRRTGDWDLAEECAQEAFAEALRAWPRDGIPRRPGAWLTTVAANRALDRLRRASRGNQLLEQLGRDPTAGAASGAEDAEMDWIETEPGIEDDRLRLMFTCCHPALAVEARVALTLRSLAGLQTGEIARAFLVPEATMAKRLTRAKAKIAAAGIPYRVPPAAMLPERLGGVLAVLYLLFNEGYAASSGDDLVRVDLCAEAIRLARLLTGLMPDEPEAGGLLALMLLQDSRRDARTGADGSLVTLEEQDRSRWDRSQIAEGLGTLERTVAPGEVGPYALQAMIAACHARVARAADTDWAEICSLYELLLTVLDSPVVRLNHAVAVAMADSPERGLALVDQLAHDGGLAGYHLLEATRADLLRRAGDLQDAATAYERAIALVTSEPERNYLQRRLQEVRGGRRP